MVKNTMVRKLKGKLSKKITVTTTDDVDVTPTDAYIHADDEVEVSNLSGISYEVLMI